ncbi:MAG: hypothetical protein IKV79_08550 [Oscillospiraceae bacterium]|nr:hypothetical protein [Oscillospiraceae bacterium]
MKKIVIAIIAILDGLLMAAATTAVILSIIYATSIGPAYLLLALAPVPVYFIHRAAYRLCDRLQGSEE